MVARALAPYVAEVIAYDMAMPARGVHRGLPSTTLTFVLPVGDPLEVSWGSTPASRHSSWSLVSGLHAAPAHIHHGKRQAGVQLAITPLGVRALLGTPLSAFSGQFVALEDLGRELPRCLARLPEEVNGVSTAQERIQLVERRLMQALTVTGARAPGAAVAQALVALTGSASVGVVADEIGYSRRHLAALVSAECGVSPKTFQRLSRFEESRRRWGDWLVAGRGSLSDLASVCGYADQSHLTREWGVLAGCTPTAWAREEFPFVQDQELRAAPS